MQARLDGEPGAAQGAVGADLGVGAGFFVALRLARGLGGPQKWQRSEHGFPEAIISRSVV